ncbi:MAG: beta-N-acetylhexosaminidase [Gemmatimonas sp.]
MPAPAVSPSLTKLDDHRVVPLPASVVPAPGAPFVFSATTGIVAEGPGEVARTAELFAKVLRKSTAFPLRVTRMQNGRAVPTVPRAAGDTVRSTNVLLLRIDSTQSLAEEAYTIAITADTLRIVAAKPAGIFYGIATLRQLLPFGVEAEQSALRLATNVAVPAGTISDSPRFAWRGSMLDVARHFFTVDEVKQHLDFMSLYKFNTLHLHLADDQGWRIQIASWPKLATVGGSTEVGAGEGGYYTKADYAAIVKYATERYITIVPEIDMPGHTNAAIAAYPKLGCSRATPNVLGAGTQAAGTYTGIRVGWSSLCADKEYTYQFVDDVVRELAAMTPGKYIHIGGDEVEVLNNAQYANFIDRTQRIVTKYGKIMVGWEEIGKAKLRPGSIAQFWRSDTALLAARQGNKLIMSPGPKTYLDMKYTPNSELGLRWAGYIEVRGSYDWDPVTYAPGLGEDGIIGVEAPLWSETVKNLGSAQYQMVPRLPALAEVGWSAQSARTWEGFRTRIAAHAPRWRLLGVNFYPSPEIDWAGIRP